MEIGAPTVTDSKIVLTGVIGVVAVAGNIHLIHIINMLDRNGHPQSVKTHILPDPGQTTGVVIDVARAGPAGADAGIVPIILYAVIVSENNVEYRSAVVSSKI